MKIFTTKLCSYYTQWLIDKTDTLTKICKKQTEPSETYKMSA